MGVGIRHFLANFTSVPPQTFTTFLTEGCPHRPGKSLHGQWSALWLCQVEGTSISQPNPKSPWERGYSIFVPRAPASEDCHAVTNRLLQFSGQQYYAKERTYEPSSLRSSEGIPLEVPAYKFPGPVNNEVRNTGQGDNTTTKNAYVI